MKSTTTNPLALRDGSLDSYVSFSYAMILSSSTICDFSDLVRTEKVSVVKVVVGCNIVFHNPSNLLENLILMSDSHSFSLG